MQPFRFDTQDSIRGARRDRLARRVLIAALVVVVALGLFNVLGARRAEVEARGADGTLLKVEYPVVTRAALSAPLVWTVTRAGGFGDDPVVLRISQSWFELFDYNDVEPQPAATTYAGGEVEWEFDPPAGDTLRVQLDGRIDPSSRGKREAQASVMDGERVVVRARYSTRVLP
jgi:hypothetical protein